MFGVLTDGEQQPQLLREHVVVVLEVHAEQAERLDERTAPRDDLGAAVADQVEGGEVLVQPDRIGGGQHRHGTGQPDAAGGLGDRGQRDGGVGDCEVPAVVLAETEDVQAGLVGGDGVGDDLAGAAPRVVQFSCGGVGLQVGQGDDAQFHGRLR